MLMMMPAGAVAIYIAIDLVNYLAIAVAIAIWWWRYIAVFHHSLAQCFSHFKLKL